MQTSWHANAVQDSAAHLQVWNKHLPHSRAQCGVYPFTAGRSYWNAPYCSQCFCYICDVPASTCRSWGTGAHCCCYLYRQRCMHRCRPPPAMHPGACVSLQAEVHAQMQTTSCNAPWSLCMHSSSLLASGLCAERHAAQLKRNTTCNAGISGRDHCNAHSGSSRYPRHAPGQAGYCGTPTHAASVHAQ